MTPSVKVNLEGWRIAAKKLWGTETKRELEDFLNGQALKVAIEAIRHTGKADASRVQWQLGVTGRELRYKIDRKTKQRVLRGGKAKQGDYIIKDDSLAERILIARRIKTGSWGIRGASIKEKVKEFIKARMRSVAFIKSGWIPARQRLFSVVRQKPTVTGVKVLDAKQYGKPKGYAIPAAGSLFKKLTATIVNLALNAKPNPLTGTIGNAAQIAENGLALALKVAEQDMLKKLKERLDKQAKKAGFK